jgi:hypothetical protein
MFAMENYLSASRTSPKMENNFYLNAPFDNPLQIILKTF